MKKVTEFHCTAEVMDRQDEARIKREEGNRLGGVKRVRQRRKLLVQHMHA